MTETTLLEKKQKKTPGQRDPISASQVTDYLLKNTDFFKENEYLLADLILPHASGAATSLVERQASVMRSRNSELRGRLTDLIATARNNDHLFKLIKKLSLKLLEADSLDECASSLRHCILDEFKLDCVNLMLFDQPQLKSSPLISETSHETAKDVLGKLLRNDRIICSTLRINELQYLFPNYAEEEGSAAIVPLQHKQIKGLLLIGSHDPQHFGTNLDTTFIKYMGQIISRRLSHFLDA